MTITGKDVLKGIGLVMLEKHFPKGFLDLGRNVMLCMTDDNSFYPHSSADFLFYFAHCEENVNVIRTFETLFKDKCDVIEIQYENTSASMFGFDSGSLICGHTHENDLVRCYDGQYLETSFRFKRAVAKYVGDYNKSYLHTFIDNAPVKEQLKYLDVIELPKNLVKPLFLEKSFRLQFKLLPHEVKVNGIKVEVQDLPRFSDTGKS